MDSVGFIDIVVFIYVGFRCKFFERKKGLIISVVIMIVVISVFMIRLV